MTLRNLTILRNLTVLRIFTKHGDLAILRHIAIHINSMLLKNLTILRIITIQRNLILLANHYDALESDEAQEPFDTNDPLFAGSLRYSGILQCLATFGF